MGLTALVLCARPYLWPRRSLPFTDGPIMVLGGGSGERLQTALAIRGQNEERVLVVSAEAIDDWEAIGGTAVADNVVCVHPEPFNTFGEASAVADLVEEHGWSRLTVVTSDFHVTRTRWHFQRCIDVPLRVVAAKTDGPSPAQRGYRVVREMAATLVAPARGTC